MMRVLTNWGKVRWLAALALIALIATGAGCASRKHPPVEKIPPGTAALPAPGGPLAWDALRKDYVAGPDDLIARFFFLMTNVSPSDVYIGEVKTSCGCTTAKLPGELPWKLPPGGSGRIDLSVDLRGKSGDLFKSVTLRGTNLNEMLNIKITIPAGHAANGDDRLASRNWNREMASADRQAVFKNDCVKCHLEPAFGKTGAELYEAVCAICHDSPNRASMVPDLAKLKHPASPKYWREWITNGKPGTLMPAFVATAGGPLDEGQITSLVAYLDSRHGARGGAKKSAKSK